MADFNSYPDGLMLTVYYKKSIVAVSITSLQQGANSTIVDPYGVKLNNTSERLITLRGKPDAIDGNVWRYGPGNAIHWDYTVKSDHVTTILLSAAARLP